MHIETTIEDAEVSLGSLPAVNRTRTIRLRAGLFLGRLVIAGLLVTYFVALVQDFQRIRRLEAEPTRPSKVISKYQAWERVHPRPVR